MTFGTVLQVIYNSTVTSMDTLAIIISLAAAKCVFAYLIGIIWNLSDCRLS